MSETASAKNDERLYDVTVLGVTGYTGKLVVKYLNELRKRNAVSLPQECRLCFAGRKASKVQEIADSLGPDLKPAIVAADVADEASIEKLAADSKVLLTCVGPYDLYGEVVVKACVSQGTDYVDITGENRWVESMRERYDESAKKKGIILIPFAGHDCVPVDLCAWFTTSQVAPKEMEESHAALITATKLPHNGTLSHGTFSTILRFAEQNRMEQYDEVKVDNSRLSSNIQLLPEIPPEHGGPLAIMPTRVLPDGKVAHNSQLRQPQGRAGVFENINCLVFPNRGAAASSWFSIKALPYVVKVPFVMRTLRKTMESGSAMSRAKADEAVNYSTFGVLKLFPLKGGNGNEPPVETIVTRLDVDRDPYHLTAITCSQIALALANPKFRASCPGAETGFGFHTPVSAIGGQEILDRCNECFRAQVICRL